jgi:hypothetical protein
MSLSNNFPAIRPSLLLDFANTTVLDPRITFTRASTATYYDGVTVAKAEENLLTYSQEFDNAAWQVGSAAVTANSTTAPDGTSTADTLTATASTNRHSIFRFPSTVTVSGASYAMSCFVKANTNNFVQFFVPNQASDFANFNLSSGTVGTTGGSVTAAITSVGNSWYRISMIYTAGGTDRDFSLGLTSSSSAARGESWTTAGTESVYIWGAQLEQRSSVTAYTATTTEPITNYIPVLLTAPVNTARFEHNPTTGESLGLEIEEQRTNLLLYSEQFDNAYWTKQRSTITTDTNIAPDGVLSADKLVENTTASNTHEIFRQPTISSSTAYTFSAYVKAAERTWVFLNLNNPGVADFRTWFNLSTGAVGTNASGTTASITSVGNGWYRLSVTRTSAAGQTSTVASIGLATADNVSSYTGDGYSGVFIWGAQLEAGAFATSYIPTVASQVTRSADSATMTGTNFSSWYRADEGTSYVDVTVISNRNFADSYPFRISVGGNSFVFGYYEGGTVVRPISSGTVVGNAVSIPSGSTAYKSVGAYTIGATASAIGAVNSTLSGANANLGAFTSDTNGTATIGGFNAAAGKLNGTIKKLAYYPLRLTNAQLQALTSS